MKKNLIVFDFDYTIVDDNSDTAVFQLVGKDKIEDNLQTINKDNGWTAYMQEVFSILHQNGITKTDIDDLIRKIPEVDGMINLISQLNDNMNYDVIIISDSNTYFISLWLETHNLDSKVLKIFSNPARFNQFGLLEIEMYHIQDSCKLSTKNMCKGMIMEDFIKQQASNDVQYNRVAYVGDGKNDFCPILRLKSGDLACARKKYKCAKMIDEVIIARENGEIDKKGYDIKADTLFWINGNEILHFLKKE